MTTKHLYLTFHLSHKHFSFFDQMVNLNTQHACGAFRRPFMVECEQKMKCQQNIKCLFSGLHRSGLVFIYFGLLHFWVFAVYTLLVWILQCFMNETSDWSTMNQSRIEIHAKMESWRQMKTHKTALHAGNLANILSLKRGVGQLCPLSYY